MMQSKNLDQAPQRASRGRQVRAAAMLAGVALLLAVAGTAAEDDATRAFLRCMALQDNTERLACYDRLAREVVELGLPGSRATSAAADVPAAAAGMAAPAVVSGAPQPSAAQSSPEEAFGMAQPSPGREVSSITASVVGGFAGWGNGARFELDNGQVWEQVGSDRFAYSGRDRQVVIRRGLFGSFLLSPEGLNRSVRVRRIE